MPRKSSPDARLDYRDYLGFPNDGRRHELVAGEHVVNPAPSTYHQTISRRIHFQLYTQIELQGRGEVFYAPTDLELSPHDIVQPDLLIVLAPSRSTITETRIIGPPQLIVEILSPSSSDLDRHAKKDLYQRAGVPEYWIVDPVQRRLEQWVLDRGAYQFRGAHTESVPAGTLPGISVDLTQVW
jgi:Uma2 family endonuclease